MVALTSGRSPAGPDVPSRGGSGHGGGGGERAVPFYCPYCGEETLRPFGELDDPHGQWRCDSCRRAFRLKMLGLLRPDEVAG